MNNLTKLATIAACFLVVGKLEAKDAVDPGQADNTWVVGLAGGAINNPYAGEDTDGIIIPRIRYNGERFFFNENGVGVNLFSHNHFSGGLLLTSDMSFLADHKDYRNNAKLAGLKERDHALEAGFYINHSTDMGRLRFTALSDASSTHKGHSLGLEYIADLEYGDWHINPYAGVNWVSDKKADHHFGVRSEEVSDSRALYKADDSFGFNAGLRGRYSFNKNWDFTFNSGYGRLDSGISDSPIVEDKNIYYGTVGVNYNF